MSNDIAALYIRVDSTGAVTASKDLAALDTAAAKVEGSTKKVETATASTMANFKKLAGVVGATALAYQAFMKLMSELNQLVREGFKAVEEYHTSIASLAAMVLTFTKAHNNMSLGERWKEALKYSTEMIPILENLAAKTLLSGRETTALANAFARAGVFLDATNAKQIESFTRLSNALPLMTQGQSIMLQINQEIRGLMGGGNEATSMLLQTLKSINPEIENQLKVWRAEGTVLEHLGDLLVGFGPATAILENQWQAVKSTIDTTVTQTLRGGMQSVYQDIIGLVKNMDNGLIKHKGTISAGIVVAWNSVKNILAIVWNVIAGLKPLLEPLVSLTGAIAYGWGGILAVLEPISRIVGNILSMGVEIVKTFGNAAQALLALISLQPKAAKMAADEAIKSAKQVGALVVENGNLFINGISDSLVKYDAQVQKAMTSSENLAAANKYIFEPVTKGADEASGKITKAAQKLREEADKINETLGNDIKMSGLDDLEKKLFEIQIKYEKLGKNPLVDKGLLGQARGIEESAAISEANQKITESNKKMYEELKKGKEEYEALLADLQGAILKGHEKALHEISKAEEEVYKKIEKLLDEAKISWEQAELLFKLTGNKTEKSTADETVRSTQSASDYYSQIEGYAQQAYEKKIDLIELERQANINMYGDVAAANAKANQSQIKAYSEKIDADQKWASIVIGNFGSMLDAAKECYDEDSSEYNRLNDMKKAVLFAQLAMEAVKNVRILAGIRAQTAATVTAAGIENAANSSKAVTGAVAAIATQGSGDPYTAFARIAAMIALMTSVLAMAGIAFSGGGGGSSSAAASGPSYGQDTTVLGGANGQASESITKSLELLQDTYEMEDTKLTKIYNEMKNLNWNITGVVKSVVLGDIGNMTEGQLAAATPGWKAFDEKYFGSWIAEIDQKFMDAIGNIPIIGGALDSVVSFLVGGSGGEKSLKASGIRVGGESLLASEKKGSWIAEMGQKFMDAIGNIPIIGGALDSVISFPVGGSGGESSGGESRVGGAVNPYDIVHTAGVNSSWGFGGSDEYDTRTDRAIDDSLTAFFFGPNGLSATTSKMFYDVAGGLGKDADAAAKVITDAFLNIGDINLMGADTPEKIQKVITDRLSKLEDVAARSIFGDEYINKYIKVNEGAAETIFRLYIDLESVNSILDMTTKSTISRTVDLAESLIELAGGLDKLQESATNYYNAFFNDKEKQEFLKSQLSEALSYYGMDLPGTRSGYRALVESQTLSTEQGAARYAELLMLAETADKYYKYIEKAAETAKGSLKPEHYSTNLEYQRALAGLQSFDNGGMSVGPESGYVAQLHGTELIVSPRNSYPATVKGLSNDEVVAEIRGLRKDIGQGNFYSKANSDKITSILNRWEGSGLPETRT